jgi:hypothetical protein
LPLPQSENINRQGAKIAKTEMVMWGTTDKTSESPRNRFCVLRWKDREHRILGGPGTQRWRWVIMAVQAFSRIRANFLSGEVPK